MFARCFLKTAASSYKFLDSSLGFWDPSAVVDEPFIADKNDGVDPITEEDAFILSIPLLSSSSSDDACSY